MTLKNEAVDALADQYRGTAAWVDVTGDYRIRDWQY